MQNVGFLMTRLNKETSQMMVLYAHRIQTALYLLLYCLLSDGYDRQELKYVVSGYSNTFTQLMLLFHQCKGYNVGWFLWSIVSYF